jgi:hypothetical protein
MQLKSATLVLVGRCYMYSRVPVFFVYLPYVFKSVVSKLGDILFGVN